MSQQKYHIFIIFFLPIIVYKILEVNLMKYYPMEDNFLPSTPWNNSKSNTSGHSEAWSRKPQLLTRKCLHPLSTVLLTFKPYNGNVSTRLHVKRHSVINLLYTIVNTNQKNNFQQL